MQASSNQEEDSQFQRQQALGNIQELSQELKISLQSIIPLFKPMPEPQFNDWLSDHNQVGQSFQTYQQQVHNNVDQERNIIYILPLQQILSTFLDQLKQYCECFFHPMKIQIMQTGDLKNITQRINPYGNIKQYNAKQIMNQIKKQIPKDGFCIIGVCLTDLYPKQEWNFVFGFASFKQRTGVFSFARYQDSFYDCFYQGKKKQSNYYHEQNVKKKNNKYKVVKVINEKTLWRSISVMVHEITHMFGMKHCIFYKCVMNGYNHLQQLDGTPLQLCPVCLRKLQSNINFNILQRYKKLFQHIKKKGDKSGKKILQFLQTAIKSIQQGLIDKK